MPRRWNGRVGLGGALHRLGVGSVVAARAGWVYNDDDTPRGIGRRRKASPDHRLTGPCRSVRRREPKPGKKVEVHG